MSIKAISLWQPWASLMSTGAKTVETRSWRTHYRGLLAIHAVQRPMDSSQRALCDQEPFSSALAQFWRPEEPGEFPRLDLPFGCVVAVVTLLDCRPTPPREGLPLLHWQEELSETELTFGDYSPGRYGWVTELVKRIDPPIAAVGHQGLWSWDVPAGVL